ncbi:MAG: ABC transporter permease [Nitrospinae bacterium]|nr:ABC transporter permease [Nitrospinota bacterium]
MSYELKIGVRYLKAKRKQAFISLITWISIGGVTVGVMALIIVLAVMSGFEEDLRDKILGTNSHIVVVDPTGAGMENYAQLIEKVRRVDHVASVAPFIYNQVMLTSETSVSGVVIRGIDPRTEGKVTNLVKNLKEGKIDLLDRSYSPDGGVLPTGEGQTLTPGKDKAMIGAKGIILGKELAKNLGVFKGQEVTVISPLGSVTVVGMVPRMKRFRVVGIFDSGMFEYDSSLAFISLESAQRFFNMGAKVTGIEVKIDDIYRADQVARAIQKVVGFPYWVRDWMQLNRNLFSALKLEKIAMFIILVLIVLVAAFNIISTLIMVVMEKNKDIAILKSMGASNRSIMKIFMMEGLVIGVAGTVIGSLGGWLACHLLDRYQFIKLPSDIYYLSTLPVKMEPLDIGVIALAAIGISFLATLYPSWNAARMNPVEALRYE